MKKKIIILILAIITFFLMLIYFSNRFINKRVEKELSMLQATAYVLPDIDMYSLDSIPVPILKYISSALNKNYKYYRMVEILYSGNVKLDSKDNSFDCSGKIYFGQYQPGLLQTETVTIFPLWWLKKRNFYIDGNGSILIKKLSLTTTQNIKGQEVNLTELTKYISFTPLFPWIYLNRGIIQYLNFDTSSIKIEVKDKTNKITLEIFVKNDTISEIKTKDNFIFDENQGTQTELSVKYSEYKNINGVLIPSKIEAYLIDNIKTSKFYEYYIEEYKYY
ncbi:MAG TPA: hypothetical protein PKW14_12570 [Bacteroidota bacterium]|nr:hypothetical protein [Bacteroidota bacterium]